MPAFGGGMLAGIAIIGTKWDRSVKIDALKEAPDCMIHILVQLAGTLAGGFSVLSGWRSGSSYLRITYSGGTAPESHRLPHLYYCPFPGLPQRSFKITEGESN